MMAAAAMVLVQCFAAAGAEPPEGQAKGRENQPPVLVVNIPLQTFPEDNIGNKGYRLVNLSKFFSDDSDGGNLTFSVVLATDPSHICATVDGHFLSFTTPTNDWYGQEKFRVRATDSGGLWAESNDFTVRVTPVSDELHIHELPILQIVEYTEYFFDLTPYLHSDFDAPEDIIITTNSSDVRVEGRVLFIRTGVTFDYVPTVETVQIIAIGSMNEARAELKLFLLEYTGPIFIDPPPMVTFFIDLFIMEDMVWLEDLFFLQPLNPGVYWNITNVSAGNPPMFEATMINDTIMRIAPALHQYGRAGSVVAVATVPKGKKFNFYFNVIIQHAPVYNRLTRINDTVVYEHQNVSFRLIKEDRWEDLVFWTNSTIFNISREGWVNFTPDQEDVGRWHIYYCVSLWGEYPDELEFNLTVLNANDPPENASVLKPQDGKRFRGGARIEFEGNATDSDGDLLNFTWCSDGQAFAWGKAFWYRDLAPGRHRITLDVSDGEYTMSSRPVEVTVEPASSVGGPSFPQTIVLFVCALAAAIGGLLFLRRNRHRPTHTVK